MTFSSSCSAEEAARGRQTSTNLLPNILLLSEGNPWEVTWQNQTLNNLTSNVWFSPLLLAEQNWTDLCHERKMLQSGLLIASCLFFFNCDEKFDLKRQQLVIE